MTSPRSYEEFQFLGYNRFATSRRMIVALFCFLFYFVSEETTDESSNLFFYLGVIVLVITVVAMFIPHCTTRISDGELQLIGPVSFRSVTIDLKGADSFRICNYSKFLLNRPVFNLHRKNVIRFYTFGKEAIEFTTAKGERIRLGTQRPEALKMALEENARMKESDD